MVTGAGPSLEAQAAPLAGLRESACLIATDASLPALLGLGLTPDLVVSIDCQLYSYHHFLQGLPAGVPLALDLASPPVLGRLAPRARYFAGGHPLSRYVSAHWLDLPALDTSGGNVAQAAVSLAVSLGAREIFLAGLDFSYPQGKAYSRGTFLYPIAAAAQSRLAPVESWFQDFLLARGSSRPLDLYRRRLEAYARTVPARLTVLPGASVELDLPREPVVSEAASRLPHFRKAFRILARLPGGLCRGPARPARAFLPRLFLLSGPFRRIPAAVHDPAAGSRGPAGEPAGRRARGTPGAGPGPRVGAGEDQAPPGKLIAA